MTSSKNIEFKKNSFLNKSNSAFIEEMYVKYIEKDPNLPESWKNYFSDLDEDIQSVIKEVEGPSWARRKKINVNKLTSQTLDLNQSLNTSQDSIIQSIKAIALIRAYRIRGHLIASLDPLGMMERKYIHELHPEDHGFKKEDYDKKIFIGSYLDTNSASVNQILKKLRKVYCSNIGVEYMHISDPVEKVWFRERMEKQENQIKFTTNG